MNKVLASGNMKQPLSDLSRINLTLTSTAQDAVSVHPIVLFISAGRLLVDPMEENAQLLHELCFTP